jgi:hypothetical protein
LETEQLHNLRKLLKIYYYNQMSFLWKIKKISQKATLTIARQMEWQWLQLGMQKKRSKR